MPMADLDRLGTENSSAHYFKLNLRSFIKLITFLKSHDTS